MPWVQFTDDCDWSPSRYRGRVVIAYKRGMVVNVTRACALFVVSAGMAVSVERPSNGERQRRGIPQADDGIETGGV